MTTDRSTGRAIAAVLVAVVIAGCGTPLPSSTAPSSSARTSTPSPAISPSPTSSAGVAFTCPGFPGDGTGSPPASPVLTCSTAEAAVLVAAGSGRSVKSVAILPGGFFCDVPFSEGLLVSCPRPNSGPAAYATFVGTDKVMALLIGIERGGSGGVLATVVAFEVPPVGWAMPDQSPSVPLPSPVGGGCGSTQVFSGPGPDASSGLAANPWAWATPKIAGIIAYFWYAPPDLLLAHGPSDHTKILWLSGSQQAPVITIHAHPLGASSPAVEFSFPASASGGYPSLIDLPSPGCWRLEVTVGTAQATMDLHVAPAG